MGGISTGEDINIRMALKPPSSIPKPQKTLDENSADFIFARAIHNERLLFRPRNRVRAVVLRRLQKRNECDVAAEARALERRLLGNRIDRQNGIAKLHLEKIHAVIWRWSL